MRRFINLCNYWFGLSLVATALWSELLSLLEGSAYSLRAACSVAGTYGDLLCGAVGVAIVMHTVLYVTANSLDMLLLRALLLRRAFFILIHFLILLIG